MARRSTASTAPPEATPEGTDPASASAEPGTASEAGAASTPGAVPATESRFFGWLRQLGVQRRRGWLGGVCGGIAERIGVDPLLVRGVAVVLAVAGAPVALLYALAWFLLPGDGGVIHAQQLGHGRVTRALPGIVGVFLASFLPLTQVFWWGGAAYWSDLGWGGAFGRIVWTGVLLILVIVLVVWLARRSGDAVPVAPAAAVTPAAATSAAPATGADRDDTAPEASDAAAADAASASETLAAHGTPASAVPEPGEPPAPPADANAEELAAWKASQDAWQKQRAAWAAEQRRSERERRQAIAQAQAEEAARLGRERARIRKLTRPRASASIVFLVFGAALIAAAITALLASQSDATRGAEWMVGAATLVLVFGVGTVAVALGRRRSGALAFFSGLAVLTLAASLFVPTDRQLLAPWVPTSLDTIEGGSYAQLTGTTYLYVQNTRGADAPADTIPVVDLWQLDGYVNVNLAEGATVRFDVRAEHPGSFLEVSQEWADGGSSSSFPLLPTQRSITVGPGEPDVVVRVDIVQSGWIWVDTRGWTEPVPLSPASDDVAVWQNDENGMSIPLPDDAQPDPTASPIPDENGGDTTVDEGATP